MGQVGLRIALSAVVLLAGVALAACSPQPPDDVLDPTPSPTVTPAPLVPAPPASAPESPVPVEVPGAGPSPAPQPDAASDPSEDPANAPGPVAAPAPAPDPHALAGFIDSCEQNAEAWAWGEARYPRTFQVDLDQAATYRAGVAIDGAAQVLEAQLPAAEGFGPVPVGVSCRPGARLTSTDGTIDIDEDGWILLPFAQPGMVQWSWSVTANEPGVHELLLELRPAVAVGDGGYYPPEGPTVPLPTNVHVEATVLQLVSDWWEEYWDTVATIAAAAGAAIIGVITWLRNLGRAVRGKEPDEPADEPADAAAAPGPPKPPADG